MSAAPAIRPPAERQAMGRMGRVAAAAGLAAGLLAGTAALASAQDTHVIVIVGVGGTEEHAKQFHQWAVTVVDAAKRRGIPEARITYLGEKPEMDAARIRGRSNRDGVTRAFADVTARAKPNDEVFVILFGHGSYDGRQAAFNLPGPDLTADDYKALLDKLRLQKIVFVNTASASGGFLSALAGPGRTIVTATKTGGERNETLFPGPFVEALAGEAADRDRNGRVSVLEAFDFAKARVTATYEQGGNILTEHATLDDGASGKFAATLFLAPERSRTAEMATASPELRALVEQRDALERQIAELKLKKDGLDPARYDQDLEKLLTDLALKTRALRDLEAKK